MNRITASKHTFQTTLSYLFTYTHTQILFLSNKLNKYNQNTLKNNVGEKELRHDLMYLSKATT